MTLCQSWFTTPWRQHDDDRADGSFLPAVATVTSQTVKHIFRLHFNPQKKQTTHLPFLSRRLNLERRPSFHLIRSHPHTSSANLHASGGFDPDTFAAAARRLARGHFSRNYIPHHRGTEPWVFGYRTVHIRPDINKDNSTLLQLVSVVNNPLWYRKTLTGQSWSRKWFCELWMIEIHFASVVGVFQTVPVRGVTVFPDLTY